MCKSSQDLVHNLPKLGVNNPKIPFLRVFNDCIYSVFQRLSFAGAKVPNISIVLLVVFVSNVGFLSPFGFFFFFGFYVSLMGWGRGVASVLCKSFQLCLMCLNT